MVPHGVNDFVFALFDLADDVAGEPELGARGIGREIERCNERDGLAGETERAGEAQRLAAVGVNHRGVQDTVAGIVENLPETAAGFGLDEQAFGMLGEGVVPPAADVAGHGVVAASGLAGRISSCCTWNPPVFSSFVSLAARNGIATAENATSIAA